MVELKNTRAAGMQNDQASCLASARPCRLVLLGAPGVGKGTQAELFSARLGACHLSTGDIFRAAQSLRPEERSAALSEALTFMSQGRLVPDATVLAVVREHDGCLNCPCGFLLDGFPRTVTQAEALEKLLQNEGRPLTGVIDYQLPIDQIVERISGRRTCVVCRAVYHGVSHPPRIKDVCDRCGGSLYQREDDQPSSVRVRMKAYQENTLPLIEYYRQRGLLKSINADGTPVEIFQRTLAAFNGAMTAEHEKQL
jgi:adenylate kinase